MKKLNIFLLVSIVVNIFITNSYAISEEEELVILPYQSDIIDEI